MPFAGFTSVRGTCCERASKPSTNPQEGIRSVNAFKNFLGLLVRGEKAVAAPVLPTQTVVNELWGSRMRVPRGRMEEVAQASFRAA